MLTIVNLLYSVVYDDSLLVSLVTVNQCLMGNFILFNIVIFMLSSKGFFVINYDMFPIVILKINTPVVRLN
jgi:hypothetical protein